MFSVTAFLACLLCIMTFCTASDKRKRIEDSESESDGALSGDRRAKLIGRLVGAIAGTHLDGASVSAATVFAILAASDSDVSNALYKAVIGDQAKEDVGHILHAVRDGHYVEAASTLARVLGLGSSVPEPKTEPVDQDPTEGDQMDEDKQGTPQVTTGGAVQPRPSKRRMLFRLMCTPASCLKRVAKNAACRVVSDVMARKSLDQIKKDVITDAFGAKSASALQLAEALVAGDVSKAIGALNENVKGQIKTAPINMVAASVIEQGVKAQNPKVEAAGYLLKGFVGADWEAVAHAADLLLGTHMVGPAIKFLNKYVIRNDALGATVKGFFKSVVSACPLPGKSDNENEDNFGNEPRKRIRTS